MVLRLSGTVIPGRIFPLGSGLQSLNRQIDLSVVCANNHHLHILPFGQMLPDIADISIGNLGNMYHSGLIFRQGYKCAKICDGLDFSFQDGSNG